MCHLFAEATFAVRLSPGHSRTLVICRYQDVVFYTGYTVREILMKNWRFTLLGIVSMLSVASLPVQAQPKARAGGCLVSEFRSLALLTHDVSERIAKVSDWLNQNGEKCTQAQLMAIASNRATWLGTADTVAVVGKVDGLIEAKIARDPDLMAAMYTSKGKETRASVEITKPPAAPAPVVPAPAAGLVGGPQGNMIQPVIVQAAGAEPAEKPKAPEAPDGFLGRRQKVQITEFFEENRGTDECPKGLVKRGTKCEAQFKERDWKLRQPLPASERPEELPLPLLVKLGPPPPDHQYKRVGADILLLKGPQNIVVDAVLDLGGVSVKVASKGP